MRALSLLCALLAACQAADQTGTPPAVGTDAGPVPVDSPRILVLGPGVRTPAIVSHLQAMLSADPAFSAPLVTGLAIEASTNGGPADGGLSLMNFFYYPDGREARLAPLANRWSYVVLLEQVPFALQYPELYFEGVRVLGDAARAAGATPVVLMTWSWLSTHDDTPERGEVTYRVARGTGSLVAPAGYAWEAAQSLGSLGWQRDDVFVAAATLYSTVTGRNAADTGYRPPEIALAAQLATVARDSVVAEAAKVHYQAPWSGIVQRRELAPGDFWFMDSGTSSEQIWFDRMNEILPRAGFVADGTQIGYTNPEKLVDSAAVDAAAPFFQQQQYQVLFARGYTVDSATIAAAGNQKDLQVQVWDRHVDSDPSDGLAAVGMMEYRLTWTHDEAATYGLALIPYHLMFARLKTARPSVSLLSDGTHATYPVGYGLATMSVVSRTGAHVPIDGLDADTQLAAQLGEETIRQLSALSVSGDFVPDVATR
jgi:hypothetical protein